MSSNRRRGPSREPLLSRTGMDGEIEDSDDVIDRNVEGAKPVKDTLREFKQLFGADEDAFDQPTTTRKELWSYYLYYNGDNGVGPGSYSQALFQHALTSAGWDPSVSPSEKSKCGSGGCVIAWGSGTKSVASVVLIANGLCFAIMIFIFVSLGSAADYGKFGHWLLLVLTIVCWVFQYCMVAMVSPDQWPAAMVFYMLSYTAYVVSAYGATLVFYAAVFPRLARYMPRVREARERDLKEGKINQEQYDKIESMERNHISNVSTAHSNIGYLLTPVINLSVLLPLEGNSFSKNLALCLTNTYWVILGIWWFIYQQSRPGPTILKGSSYLTIGWKQVYLTIGWKQVYLALREVRHLPQTFTYLLAFFLLADGLNTTGTLVFIIQNDIVSFSFLEITYLGISQAFCSIFSTFGFWYIQKYFGIKTKTPYYAYAQTMMSEVTPRGYENMFFGLFGITNRASSIIGPNVIQNIINETNNKWKSFPFLFALCAGASVIIWFVDVEKGRDNCRIYAEESKGIRVINEAGMATANERCDREQNDEPGDRDAANLGGQLPM